MFLFGVNIIEKQTIKNAMDLSLLKEVAQYIGASDIEKEVSFLEQKNAAECPLVLPLVGEFSAGKTTLINALTNSKQLETSTKPTTATIYEVHFGSEKCHADVYKRDGSVESIDSIGDLCNEKLADDAAVVEVYDTSTQVPNSIVLVDTPGLSSANARHRQALVDFLPNADGILLVADINTGGLTRSLTDFIKTMELSKRRIYLVLTYCDTKSAADIAAQKEYIESNNGISQCNMAAVAAKDGQVTELTELLKKIQSDKAKILEQVNAQRAVNIAKKLSDRIEKLKKAGSSDEDLEDAIVEQQSKLHTLNRNIDKLINSISDEISDSSRKAERTFEDAVSGRLETLVGNRSANFDAEALSIINNSSSMIVSNLCEEIQGIIKGKANAASSVDAGISFQSLDNVDLSKFEVEGLSYNLNLNEIGHEYDTKIAFGVKIVAAAAVVATAATAVAGATAAEAGSAGGALAKYGATDAAIDAAQTATDVAVIQKMRSQEDSQKHTPTKREQIMNQYEMYEQENQEIGQKLGKKGGIVESVVGLVTDSTMGKPQRRRAVHEYIDTTLLPCFKAELQRNINALLNNVRASLQAESAEAIQSVQASLQSLKEEKQTKDSEFRARLQKYNQYLQTLNTNYLCGNL